MNRRSFLKVVGAAVAALITPKGQTMPEAYVADVNFGSCDIPDDIAAGLLLADGEDNNGWLVDNDGNIWRNGVEYEPGSVSDPKASITIYLRASWSTDGENWHTIDFSEPPASGRLNELRPYWETENET